MLGVDVTLSRRERRELEGPRHGVGWRRASEFKELITTLAIGIAALVIWIARANRGIQASPVLILTLCTGVDAGLTAAAEFAQAEKSRPGAAATGLAPRGRGPGSL